MISHMMTLANSIIGVSVLAMPYCFKQCGILLAIIILFVSSALSRLACYFLIKSAVMSRRRNFEFLAFHAFGPMGKLLVELFIIGFLLGTCIAFFVVVGDLGPQIIGEIVEKSPEDIRTSFLVITATLIVLPLGLLKNIDSLTTINTAAIGFYVCLVLKIISEATYHMYTGVWIEKVYFWRPSGILQCLPIFAMALFCQTQLFAIYDAVPNSSLEKMNHIVKGALNICTLVYLSVGFFGYIAFCTQPLTGNVLMSFEPSSTSEIIKIGFVLSVAFSFPLVIFPCRASLYSLLFRRGYGYETTGTYMPETKFRCLTIFIISISLIVGIAIPNIELVLGIVGSTIGVMICLIFPAGFFVSISTKNTNERLLAQIILIMGICIMVLGTYANLYAMEQSNNNNQLSFATTKFSNQLDNIPQILKNKEIFDENIDKININDNKVFEEKNNKEFVKESEDLVDKDKRKEPPIPEERIEVVEKEKVDELDKLESKKDKPKDDIIIEEVHSLDKDIKKDNKVKYSISNDLNNEISADEKNKVGNDEKSKKKFDADDKTKQKYELKTDEENIDNIQRQEELKKTLEKHLLEQKEMMQEQKELLKHINEQKKELEKLERLSKKKEKDDKIQQKKDKKLEDPEKLSNKEDVNKQEIKSSDIKNSKNVEQENLLKTNATLNTDDKKKLEDDLNSKHNLEFRLNISNNLNENNTIVNTNKLSDSKQPEVKKLHLEPVKKESEHQILNNKSNLTNDFKNINKKNNNNENNTNVNQQIDRQDLSIPIALKMNNNISVNLKKEDDKGNNIDAKLVYKRDTNKEEIGNNSNIEILQKKSIASENSKILVPERLKADKKDNLKDAKVLNDL